MRGGALVALGLAAACAHLPGGPRQVRDCPGPLAPTQAMGGDFLARERIEIQTADTAVRLDLAIQKRAGELVIVGFDPVGPKLFQLVQRGTEVEVEALPGRVLRVPPENVLRDVHRVRFLGVGRPAGGTGEVAAVRGDTAIGETWRDGRLARRRFEPVGGGRRVEVEFPARDGDTIRIRAPGCGYEASLTALSQRVLP